jgi:poly [ADP-ribose] polymerase
MACSDFNSKYFAKTRGGYVEIEINYGDDDEDEKPKAAPKKKAGKKQDSKLDSRLQNLIRLICDVNMINQTLSQIGYDAKKMPLGKLSSNTLK